MFGQQPTINLLMDVSISTVMQGHSLRHALARTPALIRASVPYVPTDSPKVCVVSVPCVPLCPYDWCNVTVINPCRHFAERCREVGDPAIGVLDLLHKKAAAVADAVLVEAGLQS